MTPTLNLPDKVLALASIMQITALVNDLAQKGQCDALSCDASISSITKRGGDVHEIYSADDLLVGINTLKEVLAKRNNYKTLLLYFIALIKMEKSLMQQKEMLADISSGIDDVKNSQYFDLTNKNSVAKIAEIYRRTAGQISPRIIIRGSKENLTNQNIANHIRALLLAGIRSVSLWRTLGGNLWYLFFNKKKIVKMLNTIKLS